MTLQRRRFIASLALPILAGLIGKCVAANAAITPDHAEGNQALVLRAKTLFDGTKILDGPFAVRIENGIIVKVGRTKQVDTTGARVLNVPGGTILPGFIDMHTHHLINRVPPRRMLEHGVTTARDLGSAEPITAASTNKPFQLRQFFSGPILQAPNGYPNVVFPGSGVEIAGEAAVRAKVDSLVRQGATVIAVSLEKGGEFGAPWGWHEATVPPPWATLTDDELKWIVDQAHNVNHVRVTAYLGDDESAQRALAAGVDEWAHSPCEPLSATVIAAAGSKGIAVDGTIDTEIKCEGALDNAASLVGAGAKLFYSTDMGHPDIPHGIDAQEIHMALHVGFHNGKDFLTALTLALASATSEAGKYLGLEPLGQIVPGAPGDVIVIGGDVRSVFKELEFPRVVVKDGLLVIKRAKGE